MIAASSSSPQPMGDNLPSLDCPVLGLSAVTPAGAETLGLARVGGAVAVVLRDESV